MSEYPKIIHQIWGGDKTRPILYEKFRQTWIKNHPEWSYEFWDDERIINFVAEFYPKYIDQFVNFSYDIQRWDTVRYMILYIYGGLYADFDSESIIPIDNLIGNKTCWFSLEPVESAKINNKQFQLSNAIMGACSNHDFMKRLIENIFRNFKSYKFTDNYAKIMDTLKSTGPLMLTETYEEYEYKKNISLIPHKYCAFFTHPETNKILYGEEDEKLKFILEERLKNAYTVHYFFLNWL